MGTIGWQSDTPLDEVIEKNYTGFNYYQLVKLLRHQAKARNECPEQTIRYKADLSAAFPKSEISQVTKGFNQNNNKNITTIKSPNFCIAGVMGPLSEPYLEWMRDRSRDGDRVMSDFLDLFNHRLHVLRYQLKEHRYPGLHLDKPETSTQGQFLEALIGLLNNKAIHKMRDIEGLQKRKLLAIAGLLVNTRRSAPLLERILSTLLNVPIRIEQMIGAWCDKAKQDISLLGEQNCSLGSKASLGSQVWDQQARIRLHIGPLDFDSYNELLPEQKAYEELAAVLRYVTNRAADYEVVLYAKKDNIPALNEERTDQYPALHQNENSWPVRLGQTAWLGESSPEQSTDYSAPVTANERKTRYVIPAFEVAA